MKFWTKNVNLTLKIISWIQIIGGITGLILIARLLLNTETISGVILLIFLTGISLFVFSIYTGTKLISNLDKKSGIILSIINQILQLVQWNVLGYGFSYSSGAEILIGFKGLSLSLNFSALSSSFNMSINSEGDFYLKINVLAIVIIYILYDILKSRQVNKGLA